MGNKVTPIGLRLGITAEWQSRWFSTKKRFATELREDVELRTYICKQWKAAAIASVNIERTSGTVKVIIATGKPGVLIGRGGSGIEDMTKIIRRKFFSGRRTVVRIDIKEIKSTFESASLSAQNVAEQLEKRIPFRRALKGTVDQLMENNRVQGAKIEICGRLGGAEMARREWTMKGKIPLHTLRADIDFARAEARTTYGVIGVKVWIYKGDKFEAVKGNA